MGTNENPHKFLLFCYIVNNLWIFCHLNLLLLANKEINLFKAFKFFI